MKQISLSIPEKQFRGIHYTIAELYLTSHHVVCIHSIANFSLLKKLASGCWNYTLFTLELIPAAGTRHFNAKYSAKHLHFVL